MTLHSFMEAISSIMEYAESAWNAVSKVAALLKRFIYAGSRAAGPRWR
ncbi:MAG: hypothetical protein SFY80_07240 [Verrucomicrobiota bacterium]|nr:hypothetical protein [Verrucomicrobiota bacterium]